MGARTIRRLEATKRSETSLFLEIQGVPWDLVLNAPPRGRGKRHPTLAPVLPPVHGDTTDDKSSNSSDSTSPSTSTQARGEFPRHVNVRASAQIPEVNSRRRWRANVPVVLAANVLLAATPKLHSRSSTPTKRAVESMTRDVPSQAKQPGVEDSLMDIQSMTVAGIAISGIEDEDPAEYFVDHEDAGELQDPLVDDAETEEAMNDVKLKVLDRLAEFGVYETVDLQDALRKKRVTTLWRLAVFGVYETVDLQDALRKKRVMTPWHTDGRKDGIRARFVAREFKGDEAMYIAFALSSTPSTGRIIDNLSLKKSHHTFTADVTNAYFLVDEDEECYVDPRAEWLEQQAALGNPTSVLWRQRKQLYGRRRAGTLWVDFMAEHLAEQSFDRCEAAPQFFLNYALHISIGVHMDDLHGIGPKRRWIWVESTSHRRFFSKFGRCMTLA